MRAAASGNPPSPLPGVYNVISTHGSTRASPVVGVNANMSILQQQTLKSKGKEYPCPYFYTQRYLMIFGNFFS